MSATDPGNISNESKHLNAEIEGERFYFIVNSDFINDFSWKHNI